MRLYTLIVRWLFGLVFLCGGIAHLILGRTAPSGYAVYGDTATFPWLTGLWQSFVMPNIGILTLVLGILEMCVGVCLMRGGRPARFATFCVLGFFTFLLVLGYGWPTKSWVEDFLKNRAGSILMAALVLPLTTLRMSARRRS